MTHHKLRMVKISHVLLLGFGLMLLNLKNQCKCWCAKVMCNDLL